MKKIGKKAWFAANLVLPLWEAGHLLKTARYAVKKNAERFRSLRPEAFKNENDILSFEDAVAASAQSREALMRRYLLAKRVWLAMFVIAASLIILLPVSTLLFAPPGADALLMRMVSLLFMISAFASLLFVCAMKNQFHLWQLINREMGSFSQWQATGKWLNDLFSWRAPF